MKRVLITGATGFLGGYLVKYFRQEGWSVTATGRNERKGIRLQDEDVQFCKASLENYAEIEAAMKGCDVVVHAGALSSVWGDYDDFYKANVTGTEHVLKACIRQKVKRLVFVSSPSIYTGPSDQLDIVEEDVDWTNDLNHYIRTKLLAEKVMLADQTKGLEKVIIRPRGLFGIGDTSVIPRLMRANEKTGIPVFNEGQNIIDITYVENVAYSLWLAATVEGIDGGVYNITNGEPMTFEKLLGMFLKEAGLTPKYLKVSYKRLRPVVAAMERIYTWLPVKAEPVFTRYSLMTLAFSQSMSIDKARREMGYEPQVSIEEGIRRYGAWYRKHHH